MASLNPEVDSDIPAMLAVSAALTLSGLPFNGPIGAARVGYVGGQYVLNPTMSQLKELEAKIVRSQILDGAPRIDGRDTRTVRPIGVRVGVLPRTHGSAPFTRGETQALVTVTLGPGRDEQSASRPAADRA